MNLQLQLQQFNPNICLVKQLKHILLDNNIKFQGPPAFIMSKMMGYMGTKGDFVVGDYQISTYGHYHTEDEDHFSLKKCKGKDAYWHLAVDQDGKVWFSPTGFFGFNKKIEDINDWEETSLKME